VVGIEQPGLVGYASQPPVGERPAVGDGWSTRARKNCVNHAWTMNNFISHVQVSENKAGSNAPNNECKREKFQY